MKIVGAFQRPYTLRMRRPFRTSQGTFLCRQGFLLFLRDDQGRQGVGDAAPWPGFGTLPPQVEEALQQAVAWVPGWTIHSLDDLRAALIGLPTGQARPWPVEVAHALEGACLDLLGQEQQMSIAQLLAAPSGFKARTCLEVHAGIADAVGAQQAVKQGFRVLKLKIGYRAWQEDVLRVGAIRAAVGYGVRLRVDVNGAWSVETALRAAHALGAYQLEWLEQPVAAHALDGLAAVRALGVVPVAADESIQGASSLHAVLSAQAADVVVLKPMFVGGLLAVSDLYHQAQRGGVSSVVTHACESAVGCWTAVHGAAALEGLDRACGLSSVLAEDVAPGPEATQGLLCLPHNKPGLGISLGV